MWVTCTFALHVFDKWLQVPPQSYANTGRVLSLIRQRQALWWLQTGHKTNINSFRIKSVLFSLILGTCTGNVSCCLKTIAHVTSMGQDQSWVKMPQSFLTEIQLFFSWLNVCWVATSFPCFFQSSEKVGFTRFCQCICCLRRVEALSSLFHYFCWHLVLRCLKLENDFYPEDTGPGEMMMTRTCHPLDTNGRVSRWCCPGGSWKRGTRGKGRGVRVWD